MPDIPKLTLIEVAGECHGPTEFARSPIHDNVADHLRSVDLDLDTVFVPSADVGIDEESDGVRGVQMPPSWQLDQLRSVLDQVKNTSRLPIALAHSTGSIATIAAMREGSLPLAVLVSPIFLDPKHELASPAFRRRLSLVDALEETQHLQMQPKRMGYPVDYPAENFDDEHYWRPVASQKGVIDEIQTLKDRMRLFIGGHDWNVFSKHYVRLFQADLVADEKHSFELQGLSSVEKVAGAVIELADAHYQHDLGEPSF